MDVINTLDLLALFLRVNRVWITLRDFQEFNQMAMTSKKSKGLTLWTDFEAWSTGTIRTTNPLRTWWNSVFRQRTTASHSWLVYSSRNSVQSNQTVPSVRPKIFWRNSRDLIEVRVVISRFDISDWHNLGCRYEGSHGDALVLLVQWAGGKTEEEQTGAE